MSSYLVNINGILFLLTYLQVLFVYGGSVSSTGDQFRLRGSVSSTGDQFRLRGISFVYGDQFRLRGISCFRKVATAGKTGRTGAAVGCDAARPAARRRVGEPAASAERERRGRQRRCLRLLTYLLRGISCVYGGSVVSPTKVLFVYGGSVSSTGDQFRLRGISCFRKVAWTAGKTRETGEAAPMGRTGAAVGCDAAVSSTGDPAAAGKTAPGR